MRRRRIQYPAHVSPLRISRSNRITPPRLRNLPIGKQVNNYRNLRHEPMHMPGEVIGSKSSKPNTIKGLRTHTLTLARSTFEAKENRWGS